MSDDTTGRAIVGSMGAVIGAVATGFFRWLIDRARLRADEERMRSVESRLAGVDKALEECRRREQSVRVRSARQQADLDHLKNEVRELRQDLLNTAVKMPPPPEGPKEAT